MEKILRNVVSIDESRCTGSGLCLAKCHDKALELRKGKAVLIAENLCCGLGACLAACPEKALSLVRRVAAPYQGARPLAAAFGAPGRTPDSAPGSAPERALQGCQPDAAPVEPCPSEASYAPGTDVPVSSRDDAPPAPAPEAGPAAGQGAANAAEAVCGPCSHWPLKLCVAPAEAPVLKGARILVAGDCTAFACADFHQLIGQGRAVLIGCPKFENPKALTDKMVEVFRQAAPGECGIARMEKPCCKGLVTICADAARITGFSGPIRETVVYCNGVVEEK